jgi:hypothetical protein
VSPPAKTAVFVVLAALLAAFLVIADHTDALTVGVILALATVARLIRRRNRLAAAHSRPQRQAPAGAGAARPNHPEANARSVIAVVREAPELGPRRPSHRPLFGGSGSAGYNCLTSPRACEPC